MAHRRDRISQLPTDILDHILGLLSIQDAAKIAVLSTIWRDVWSNLTCLNFDDRFFYYIDNKHRDAKKRAKTFSSLYVITKVLLQHSGTIRKFVLYFFDDYNFGKHTIRSRFYDFDQLLLLVTQKGVEEIYIRFGTKAYRLPNCIFSCLTLKRLHVYGVIVESMNSPCILPNLASLCFQWVAFGPANHLHCALDAPKLESLSFSDCLNIFHFNITAPKLSSLTIDCCCFDNSGKFLPINLDLKSISTLNLDGSLQEFVTEFTRMGFGRLNVECLKLSTSDLKCDVATPALVHLLRLCPNLCKLDINLLKFESVATKHKDALSELLTILHAVDQRNKVLHTLNLNSFTGSPSEILFIKGLLARFSALEKVVIVRDQILFPALEELTIMQELFHFPCTSTKAKIIFVNGCECTTSTWCILV